MPATRTPWIPALAFTGLLGLALACETGSAPGEPGANPPPPPSRTPTGLRHAPNTGLRDVNDELSEEQAAELGVSTGDEAPAEDDSASGDTPTE